MKSQRTQIFFTIVVAMTLTVWHKTSVQAEERAGGVRKIWNFEDIPIGQLPAGWKIDATDPKGRLAEWEVVTDHRCHLSHYIIKIPFFFSQSFV